jgi:GT2 family glycosyltransferase
VLAFNIFSDAPKRSFPKVSIIVLNFNGAKFVRKCLSSILNIKYPFYEIVFVDNGSTDNSLEMVTAEFGNNSRMKIVVLENNIGYAAGNNFGAKHADKNSKYLILSSIDTEVEPDFLEQLVTVMENDPKVGAAQPKLLLMQDKSRIDSMGALLDVIGMVHNIGGLQKDCGQYDKVREIFYAKGATMLVRKQVFEHVGGFDEDLFIWRDEADICWRIWLHGFKVISIPSSTVYHHGSGTVKEIYSSPRIKFFFFFTRNNLVTLTKSYSLSRVIKYLPIFISFQAFAALTNSLKSKNCSYALSFMKAITWNVVNLKRTLIKRQHVQKSIRRLKDEELISRVICNKLFFINQLKIRLN